MQNQLQFIKFNPLNHHKNIRERFMVQEGFCRGIMQACRQRYSVNKATDYRVRVGSIDMCKLFW